MLTGQHGNVLGDGGWPRVASLTRALYLIYRRCEKEVGDCPRCAREKAHLARGQQGTRCAPRACVPASISALKNVSGGWGGRGGSGNCSTLSIFFLFLLLMLRAGKTSVRPQCFSRFASSAISSRGLYIFFLLACLPLNCEGRRLYCIKMLYN